LAADRKNQITAGFSREELYGLTTQLRRSASSIPANLAEGCGRNGAAEFARLNYAARNLLQPLRHRIPMDRTERCHFQDR
jgi:four helix bundle protein